MEDLEIRNVSKRFGGVVALDDCSLTIRRGELIALLGPSGCGKSTLLSMIAGLQVPDSGDILFAGRSLLDVPLNRRQIGVVFQNYALFPHMTVRDNIGYGLRVRRESAAVTARRTGEVVDLLKLSGLEDRYPAELSGGQQQRVAVARAIAIRPVLMLLDEALSALDKNLRESMQIELLLLLRGLGITTILVTHDQREAFSFSDRIAIMNRGEILQVGRPQEVYEAPRSAFLLNFLGSVTAFSATVTTLPDGGHQVMTPAGIGFALGPGDGDPPTGDTRVYVRAEDISLSRTPTAVHATKPGRVALTTFLGATRRTIVDLGGEQVLADTPAQGSQEVAGAGEPVFVDFEPRRSLILKSGTA